jgi:hypothetical protein
MKEPPKDRRAEQKGMGRCVVLFLFFRMCFSHEDFDLSLAPKLVNRNKTAKKDAEQYLLDRREQTY